MATTNALTNYGENFVYDFLLRGVTTDVPNVYAALFTADPGEAGSLVNEINKLGYARVNITTNGGFSAPSNGGGGNAQDMEFPTALENWGTVTHFGIMDAATNGNMLIYGALDNPREVLTGDAVRFRAGDMTVYFS